MDRPGVSLYPQSFNPPHVPILARALTAGAVRARHAENWLDVSYVYLEAKHRRMINRTMRPNKTCPVVVRNKGGDVQILAFRHPMAGCQLVKGTIEEGEVAAGAAVRELFEEAGIQSATLVRDLGIWNSGYEGQVWSFHWCEANGLPDEWVHHTQDGGGLDFAFFWHSLYKSPSDDWHPVFQSALRWIRQNLCLFQQ